MRLTALQQPRTVRAPWLSYKSPEDVWERVALQAELPPTYGVGSNLSAEAWAKFVLQSWPELQAGYYLIVELGLTQECALKAARLAIALRLYQFDYHKPPNQVEDLVPKYLPAIPRNPLGGATAVDWVETEEIARPCLLAILLSQASIPGQTPWELATVVANISRRLPSLAGPQAGSH